MTTNAKETNTAPSPKAESASSSTTAGCITVLDFDIRDADPSTKAKTRQLFERVLTTHGPAGLARALHVEAHRASQLKHRVSCVTCRSRLDALTASLAFSSTGTSNTGDAAATTDESIPEGPAPLSAWLAADSGRALAPAPRALRDLSALAAFLGDFASNAPGAGGVGSPDEVTEDPGRKNGRSSGVVRCAHHAPRDARAPGTRSCASASAPSTSSANTGVLQDWERSVSLLHSGTGNSEWRSLGTIDVDDAMYDLFSWLGDRGLCSACVDYVTGTLLEYQRLLTGTSVCTCSRCHGRCNKAPKPQPRPLSPSAASLRLPGDPPEQIRVQGRLRAICGIYRLQSQTFNGRPVYKKDRLEAHLLHTSLNDWMISGRADAGGARCEGWAYVTDSAKSPDEITGVWKVSGPRGWEEDRTLQATAFESLPEQMRAGIGEGNAVGSAIAKGLAANERGVLILRLSEPDVLADMLGNGEEQIPAISRSGACAHISTPEAAQRELRYWLQWLLRERLDAQKRRILAQAQVGASLCHLYACAALQQLEELAERPAAGERSRAKKAKAKKGGRAAIQSDVAEPVNESEAFFCSPCAGSTSDAVLSSALDMGSKSEDLDVSGSTSATSSPAPAGIRTNGIDSDESTSTRASSEEPPDVPHALLATGARRLMQEMGWRPDLVSEASLDLAEVAAWHEQHPRYRQAISEEREKLKTQFQKWVAVPKPVL